MCFDRLVYFKGYLRIVSIHECLIYSLKLIDLETLTNRIWLLSNT